MRSIGLKPTVLVLMSCRSQCCSHLGIERGYQRLGLGWLGLLIDLECQRVDLIFEHICRGVHLYAVGIIPVKRWCASPHLLDSL